MTESGINMREFIGSVIDGRYQLDRYLAEGNFGAVFRATQMAYGIPLRDVAMKISKRTMSDQEATTAFNDALLMAKVVDRTPDMDIRQHFVSIYDAGRCPEDGPLAGHPYLVMEYIHGGSLKDFINKTPFPFKRANEYFLQMLKAMVFMHGGMDRPVAHRDIKSDNVLVSRDGSGLDRVVITDFGLAIEVDTLLGWAESGGDMAYLAPESFSHHIASPQSDVYMLALVFYEMINGRNPFSQVGRHLSGESGPKGEENRREISRLHLEARRIERFPALDQQVELRNRKEIVSVIRSALTFDMNSRPYANAVDFQKAYLKAITGSPTITAALEKAWEAVGRLTHEAEQYYKVGDTATGDRLLTEALELNQDRNQVPDGMLVGNTYLLQVNRYLQQLLYEEAGKLAFEGYNRKKCRSTIQALVNYYQARGLPQAAGFMKQLQECKDKS